MNPESDMWVDTNQLPTVTVNLTGSNDAYAVIGQLLSTINDPRNPFGTDWGVWQSKWSGITNSVTQVFDSQFWSGWDLFDQTIQRTTNTITTQQTRTGIQTSLSGQQITASVGDKLVDLSIIPYIRSRDVSFAGVSLRPRRRVYFYFDDTNVTGYVQRANEMVVSYTTGADFKDTIGNPDNLTSGSNSVTVLYATPGAASTANVVYVANVTGNIVVGQSWTGSLSANVATLLEYRHWSGTPRNANTTSITLAFDAANTDIYSGNTIYIIAGTGLGQSATIASYDATNKIVNITGAWSTTPATNSRYSIGAAKTDAMGVIAGVFVIPSTLNLRFKTGERLFRITDELSNIVGSTTTRADFKYTSQGLLSTKQDTVISTRVPVIQTASVTDDRIITSTVTQDQVSTTVIGHGGPRNQDEDGHSQKEDPMAQTFYIDKHLYPEGVFISSMSLFFANKDTTGAIPVTVQIRPTNNGFPDSALIIPNSLVTLNPAQVKISDLPDASNTATMTTFTFTAPVYLQPGEYAFVVQSASPEYEVFLAEMGQFVLGTERIVSEQPYIGSLFKSQNKSAWNAIQNQDLMFQMNKCAFDTTVNGVVIFKNDSPTTNVPMDMMFAKAEGLTFASSTRNFAFRSTAYTGGALETDYTTFIPEQNYFFNDSTGRRVLTTVDGSFLLRGTISTVNQDVSPVIDTQRTNVLAVENYINNANLSNSDIIITNGGSGYSNVSNISITITGENGTGANARANTISGGQLTSIILDSAGTGYTGNIVATVVGGAATANASVIVNNERNKSGGNGRARYITRRVTLADGFDSGDLQVIFTAYKPSGTDVLVYYKVLNGNDPESFDDKNWFLMDQTTLSIRYSQNENDLIEFQHRASSLANAITYTSGTTTYTDFKTFAVKLVLISSSTTVVPRVRDLRVLALPAA
jgi:hypothetical protein